jgi:probable DNA metabolism protein
MSATADVIYNYDGSFEGLLCCVFESYDKKEIPLAIIGPDYRQNMLLAGKDILTDPLKAKRVQSSIPKKISYEVYEFVGQAFLTCFSEKELYILLFLRQAYKCGPQIMNHLTDEIVYPLYKAVQHLQKESHLLKGFIRFSVANQVLISEIGPKNFVLPLLKQHFMERYPEERFLIYDKTHQMGLLYQPYQSRIVPIDALEMPEFDEKEIQFRQLWKLFYDTIEIKGRHNEKCRMTQMPKRYWDYMTEFQTAPTLKRKIPNGPEKLPVKYK